MEKQKMKPIIRKCCRCKQKFILNQEGSYNSIHRIFTCFKCEEKQKQIEELKKQVKGMCLYIIEKSNQLSNSNNNKSFMIKKGEVK